MSWLTGPNGPPVGASVLVFRLSERGIDTVGLSNGRLNRTGNVSVLWIRLNPAFLILASPTVKFTKMEDWFACDLTEKQSKVSLIDCENSSNFYYSVSFRKKKILCIIAIFSGGWHAIKQKIYILHCTVKEGGRKSGLWGEIFVENPKIFPYPFPLFLTLQLRALSIIFSTPSWLRGRLF